MKLCIEEKRGKCVEHHAMTESPIPIQFIGGSINGEVIEVTIAPPFYEVRVDADVMEIYERQNGEPPFIYVQIGYAGTETWK